MGKDISNSVYLQEVARQVEGSPLYISRMVEVITHQFGHRGLPDFCKLLFSETSCRVVVLIPEK